MGANFVIRTDFQPSEIQGMYLVSVLVGAPGLTRIREIAAELKAYTAAQLEELTFHAERLEVLGAGDKDVAASLLQLKAAAEHADAVAGQIVECFSKAIEFGPLGEAN